MTGVANKTKRSWTYTRVNGLDSPYLFLHPGFSFVASLDYPDEIFKKTKRSWTHMRWIRRICFFIASLVLSLALLIPKKKKMLKGP